MPSLDVSDAFDPDIMDEFCVIRRPEVVSSKGRSTVPKPRKYDEVFGVVTAAGPNELARMPEFDFSTKAIVIVTEFRLQMNSPGYKPDIVQWAGDNYLVKQVDDYSRFGAGFIQAIASSIDYEDQPPGAGLEKDCC